MKASNLKKGDVFIYGIEDFGDYSYFGSDHVTFVSRINKNKVLIKEYKEEKIIKLMEDDEVYLIFPYNIIKTSIRIDSIKKDEIFYMYDYVEYKVIQCKMKGLNEYGEAIYYSYSYGYIETCIPEYDKCFMDRLDCIKYKIWNIIDEINMVFLNYTNIVEESEYLDMLEYELKEARQEEKIEDYKKGLYYKKPNGDGDPSVVSQN